MLPSSAITVRSAHRVSPRNLMRQQFVQMNENEMDVERLTSNRHEDQRIEIGSQRGGALHSAGNRIKSSAFAKGNKMRMEDG